MRYRIIDGHALLGALDHTPRRVTRLAQFHRREMAERLAVVAAARVISELPCAALDADAQDQAWQDGVVPLAFDQMGDGNGGELLGRHVGRSGNLGAIWVQPDRYIPEYLGSPRDEKCR